MVQLAALREAFQQTYGKEPRIFSAPGRVNLIGEHTDYNDGFVLPMAIDRRTYVAAAGNGTRAVRVSALDLDQTTDFNLDEPRTFFENPWAAYIAGVAFELQNAGRKLAGTDLVIKSDVPIGAGLSSSAALEIASGKALLTLSECRLDAIELALIAQKAEHTFVGTRCGIMDQLTVTVGQAEHALLIDCRSLNLQNIKLDLRDTMVAICNTNVKHELATSAYNQRRTECEQAVEILKALRPGINALRDVTEEDLEHARKDLPELLFRRARHVVTENARTLEAANALHNGDLEKFGMLMNASHESLRDDYEVSCAELDLMVDLARKCDGVLGARMTGGGFGGCTVNLIKRTCFPAFKDYVAAQYHQSIGIKAAIYSVSADKGVQEELFSSANFER